MGILVAQMGLSILILVCYFFVLAKLGGIESKIDRLLK